MKFARIIAMFLLIVMCLSLTVACKKDENKPAAATTTAANNSNSNKDPNGYLLDKVPNANYGKDITIRCWTQSTKEYDFPEGLDEGADDVDQALFNRNRKVEDRLGVKLKYAEIAGNSGAVQEYVDDVHAAVSENMQMYDIVAAYTRCAGALSLKGDYVDLYSVDHVDTDMPWWPVEIISTNAVAGKLFVATGDIATSLIYQMEFIIINKDRAEYLGHDVQALQNLALEGDWTFDKMLEVASNGYEDSDTTPGKSKTDNFGMHFTGHPLFDMFYMGAGLKYVEATEDGLTTSSDFAGQISTTLLRKFADAFNGNTIWYGSGSPITENKCTMYTVTGETLAGSLRNATYTYHILPAPKFDLAQEDYYTAVQFPHSLYSIPKDAKDRSISGAVLEVMASESYRQVTPVLFDKVFLYKLTHAETDISMLNMIRDRTTFDLGRTFFFDLGDDTNSHVRLWRQLVENKTFKISGYVSTNNERWQRKLDEIYSKLSAIEN